MWYGLVVFLARNLLIRAKDAPGGAYESLMMIEQYKPAVCAGQRCDTGNSLHYALSRFYKLGSHFAYDLFDFIEQPVIDWRHGVRRDAGAARRQR
jgi:hypothetical protein